MSRRSIVSFDEGYASGWQRGRDAALEEAAQVALAHEEWANDPGRLEEGERRLIVGSAQAIAREIRALRTSNATPSNANESGEKR